MPFACARAYARLLSVYARKFEWAHGIFRDYVCVCRGDEVEGEMGCGKPVENLELA